MEKNKIMMFVILGLLVVLLGTTAGLTYLLYKNFNSKADAQEHSSTVSNLNNLNQEDIVTIQISDTITTNLVGGASSESNHMARLALAIGVDNTQKKESEKIIALLSDKELVIKDLVIKVMTNKTYEELKRIDAREILREEIMRTLQDEFASNLIVTVYIYEWYVV